MASYSPINVTGLPTGPSYNEYLMHAGSSSIAAEFDEATGTMKIHFTETPTFHTVGAKPESIEDL